MRPVPLDYGPNLIAKPASWILALEARMVLAAVRSVLSHLIPTCKPPLSSVPTDKEAFDEH